MLVSVGLFGGLPLSKGVQIAIGALSVALLLGGYAMMNAEEFGAFRYYQDLEEFVAEGVPGTAARVHGYVAPGSIERDVEALAVRFDVVPEAPHAAGSQATRLAVLYSSLETPDMFKDGAEVVVEGRLVATGGVFHADNVMAKCPSKFEAETPGATSS